MFKLMNDSGSPIAQVVLLAFEEVWGAFPKLTPTQGTKGPAGWSGVVDCLWEVVADIEDSVGWGSMTMASSLVQEVVAIAYISAIARGAAVKAEEAPGAEELGVGYSFFSDHPVGLF